MAVRVNRFTRRGSMKAALASAGALLACGGPSQSSLHVPLDMPEICQGINFELNVEMREVCGVEIRSYKGYKNIPDYRLLVRPKGGQLVSKGRGYELRLPNFLPVKIPAQIGGKIEFSEPLRSQPLKNQFDFQEFFPEGSADRLQMLRIDLPLAAGGTGSLCYTIPPKPTTIAPVQKGYARRLEPLDCPIYDKLRAQAPSPE